MKIHHKQLKSPLSSEKEEDKKKRENFQVSKDIFRSHHTLILKDIGRKEVRKKERQSFDLHSLVSSIFSCRRFDSLPVYIISSIRISIPRHSLSAILKTASSFFRDMATCQKLAAIRESTESYFIVETVTLKYQK